MRDDDEINRIIRGQVKKRKRKKKTKVEREEIKIERDILSVGPGHGVKKELIPYYEMIDKLRAELAKVVVGQTEVIEQFITALIANGHVLVEGVPGTAKTLIVKSIAEASGCDFGRIQFTVDLLPTDIIGITSLSPDKSSFEILKGPVFSNFLMADEINRAPPKTQSALLEAMAERQVSISRNIYDLTPPFFVMATQNPIESSGTYPLPEAQMDRFLFKLVIGYPKKKEEATIIEQNITLRSFESYQMQKVMTPEDIINLQKLVQEVLHTSRINQYIVEIVNATRNPQEYGVELGKYIDLGASPRAPINLFIAAKADAFLRKQRYVMPHNVKNIATGVLRHRIKLNYKAQVEKVKSEDVIEELLNKVIIP